MGRGHNDQAHPPIHPIKSVSLASLASDNERNIYELVTKHFLACCSRDAVGSQTDVLVQVPDGGETFHTTGLMVLQKNWLDIYKW
jgi:DNA topoisomerase-3